MLDKILRRLDVADYYSRRLDTLVSTQSGWMAKCPFHREKYGNRTTLTHQEGRHVSVYRPRLFATSWR